MKDSIQVSKQAVASRCTITHVCVNAHKSNVYRSERRRSLQVAMCVAAQTLHRTSVLMLDCTVAAQSFRLASDYAHRESKWLFESQG